MNESGAPDQNTISIIAVKASDLRDDEPLVPTLKEVSIKNLSSNLQNFLGQLDQVLKNVNDKVGGFEVDELEVYAEVTAEGKVSLLGTGVQSGATGGFKLILRRPSISK